MKLLQGDCFEVMQEFPDNSIDLVLTDPPYGLKFMGKKWDYDVPPTHVWMECLRVLKPGGHLLAFAGTRTQHRMACRIEDAGFEIRDMLAWIYGSGFPKSLDVSKAIDKAAGIWRGKCGEVVSSNGSMGGPNYQRTSKGEPATDAAREWDGWGTALKPALEPLTYAQKSFTVVPFDDIIQTESNIGALICLSLLSANNANDLLASSPKGQNEAAVSARLIAAVLRGLSQGELSETMAMFKSPEMARTIWNIAGLWKSIWGAVSARQNMFTTETAISLTTALKTFNCLISETIREHTTADDYLKLGRVLGARIAEQSLIGKNAPYKKEISVQDLVSFLLGLRPVINADANITVAARIGSTVLESVITSLEEKISPALEPITMARKPLVGTVAANVMEYGTGGLNIDACRVETADNLNGGTYGGVFGNGKPTLPKALGTGRWPANLIHDGSDDAVALFPYTKSGKMLAGTVRKKEGHILDLGIGKIGDKANINETIGDSGSAARFFYCAKASKKERAECNNHPTVKPIALMEYLVRLASAEDQTILDPFMGSGTTGIACQNLNRNFIGIEMNEEYFEIAKSRINNAVVENLI